jgi:hypothetical protein
MRKTIVRFIHEKYSPGEAAAITGVRTTLQADWRRRRFLERAPDGGRSHLFDALGVAHLFVLRQLSEHGVLIWRAADAAKIAATTITEVIHNMTLAEGGTIGGWRPASRFLVIDGERVFRTNDLRHAEEQIGAKVCIVLDLHACARAIAERLPRPAVVRVERVIDETTEDAA